MKIRFLGATQTVTGSKYYLTADHVDFFVDCGLFQGLKPLRLRNWRPLPVDLKQVEAVILTHAHIDHSGYIPLLVKSGFRGKIYCSEATRDLCEILLLDSGHLQEEEADYANRHGYSKHHPALPLYTREDAEKSLAYFKVVNFAQDYELGESVRFKLLRSGHILGSSFVTVIHNNVSITFSGDLGRLHDDIMMQPAVIKSTDYLVLESTYGNRTHDATDPRQSLGKMINQVVRQHGTIIIPAFAVGRTQSILYYLYQLKQARQIPDIPIYVDSPMATDATKLFYLYQQEHRLPKNVTEAVCRVAHYVNTIEESKRIDNNTAPKIIISASGMATGGRVLHHIRTYATDRRNAIVFAGYQATGTRGADMIQGKKIIKMFGEEVMINAHVYVLDNISAHADSSEILMWLRNFNHPPRKTFITHGELDSAKALKENIERELKWQCHIPEYSESIELV